MTVLSRVRSWLRGLLGGRRVDAEMEAEFEHHISLHAEALARAGLPAPEALRRARLEFGSTESARERGRQSRGLRLADEVRSDVRYGVRSLARAPGFLLVAVATLGLGIGANAAMFSALDAVLLRPLPFAEPDRLVSLTGVDLPFLWEDEPPEASAPQIGDAQRLGAFSHVAAYAPGAVNLSGSGPARRIRVGAVTADFLAVLGVQPARGRGFAAEETEPGGPHVAMVSESFWRTHLGGGDAPGSSIVLNGRRHEVVGVLPRGFAFPEESEVWIPLTVPLTNASFEPFRQYIPSRVIARLAAGATLAQAQAEAHALQARYARPGREAEIVATGLVTPLHGALVSARRTVLLVLLGATALVLLVACVNVAGLLLARSTSRQRELAIRTALGATPARVLRQLVVESMLLAMAGGAVGIALAYAGVHALDTLVPRLLAGTAPLRVDVRVLAFVATTVVATGLAFGMVPALGARRNATRGVLDGGGSGLGRAHSARVRKGLVLVEIALAVVLLVGSVLMLRSMHALLTRDAGVEPARVATLELTLARDEYPTAESRRRFYEAVLERVESLPAIEAAAIVNELPLRGEGGVRFLLHPAGRPPQGTDLRYMAQDNRVTPGYFDALGIRVLAGRAPRARPDTTGIAEVAINQELAATYWPDESPLGRHLEMPGGLFFEVVGVVGNVLPRALDEEPIPQAYYALLERPYSNAAVIARGRLPAQVLTRRLEDAVRAAAPHQAVYNVRTMEQVIASAIAQRRTHTWLIASFGLLAMILAATGVYGVIAFSVARRTREIGVRMALGARAGEVRRLILREAGFIALPGIIIGVAGAWALARFMSGFVFGVDVRDPLSFVAAPAVLLAAALIATLLPAQRATRIDPVVAMRTE